MHVEAIETAGAETALPAVRVSGADLYKAAAYLAKHHTDRRDPVPVLRCLMLAPHGDGARIFAGIGEDAACVDIGAAWDVPGPIVVDASALAAVVKPLRKGEVKLSQHEPGPNWKGGRAITDGLPRPDFIAVRSGRSLFNLKWHDPQTFPMAREGHRVLRLADIDAAEAQAKAQRAAEKAANAAPLSWDIALIEPDGTARPVATERGKLALSAEEVAAICGEELFDTVAFTMPDGSTAYVLQWQLDEGWEGLRTVPANGRLSRKTVVIDGVLRGVDVRHDVTRSYVLASLTEHPEKARAARMAEADALGLTGLEWECHVHRYDDAARKVLGVAPVGTPAEAIAEPATAPHSDEAAADRHNMPAEPVNAPYAPEIEPARQSGGAGDGRDALMERLARLEALLADQAVAVAAEPAGDDGEGLGLFAMALSAETATPPIGGKDAGRAPRAVRERMVRAYLRMRRERALDRGALAAGRDHLARIETERDEARQLASDRETRIAELEAAWCVADKWQRETIDGLRSKRRRAVKLALAMRAARNIARDSAASRLVELVDTRNALADSESKRSQAEEKLSAKRIAELPQVYDETGQTRVDAAGSQMRFVEQARADRDRAIAERNEAVMQRDQLAGAVDRIEGQVEALLRRALAAETALRAMQARIDGAPPVMAVAA